MNELKIEKNSVSDFDIKVMKKAIEDYNDSPSDDHLYTAVQIILREHNVITTKDAL